ncbi:MAG: S-methyl-5-thioribose-1-phosphate isomerase [Candidatus Omnitrophota bacterium]|nr:S-methyl-5-thioribose-1-phosphate isomerase [Candidatus Omnitrophota bacterium]
MAFPPFHFRNNALMLLDQRKLPARETWLRMKDSKKVHWAIRSMVVRGAPAIGVVAGYGLYLGISRYRGSAAGFFRKLVREGEYLKRSRPTGVNLRNVVDEIVGRVATSGKTTVEDLKRYTFREAKRIHIEDDKLCREIGRHGAGLFRSGDRVLTHCNAGGLATSGFGTALGVLYALKGRKKKFSVYVDETRPLLQGARLTAWELMKSKIPCTVLCDNAAASIMGAGKIDRVIVGADRIAANGDTANKIGTYNVAVLAAAHGIPFYIAAPSTTFDFKIKSGKQIPIENRSEKEVSEGLGRRITPKGAKIANPAFDVTPHRLITAFITEAGVLRRPFRKSFRRLKGS